MHNTILLARCTTTAMAMETASLCCPDNSWGAPLDVNYGTKSLDEARGELHKIGDLELYVVLTPEEQGGSSTSLSQKALCVFTDVYGLQSRLFAICDKLSSDLSITVVALDTFRGETRDHHVEDFHEWVESHPFDSKKDNNSAAVYPVKNDIESCFNFLSELYGIKSSDIGVIGFCWGVWAMIKALEMNLFRCGVGFHPSLRFESAIFGGNQEDCVKNAVENAPIFLCVAGNDSDNLKPSKEGEIAQIIESSKHDNRGNDKASPRCVEFPEMVHGWVSRGDTSVDKVKEDAETALRLACDFLSHWMK